MISTLQIPDWFKASRYFPSSQIPQQHSLQACVTASPSLLQPSPKYHICLFYSAASMSVSPHFCQCSDIQLHSRQVSLVGRHLRAFCQSRGRCWFDCSVPFSYSLLLHVLWTAALLKMSVIAALASEVQINLLGKANSKTHLTLWQLCLKLWYCT